jgi:8-oxo-dGTP pyrophosphatase MutT (NUDIX family)
MRGYEKGTSAEQEMISVRAAFARAVSAIQAGPDSQQAFREATSLGDLARELTGWAADFRAWKAAELFDSNDLSLTDLAQMLHMSRPRVHQLIAAARKKGKPMIDPGTDPEPRPVAAAIITGDRGVVLIERRNDRIPPWTFPAGEINPGESPAETIMRRVPAETGMTGVQPVELLGRRIHPKTGRVMIYMRTLVDDGEPIVGDPEDLAEVKWATIAETRELMPDMFPPVRQYLDRLEADQGTSGP